MMERSDPKRVPLALREAPGGTLELRAVNRSSLVAQRVGRVEPDHLKLLRGVHGLGGPPAALELPPRGREAAGESNGHVVVSGNHEQRAPEAAEELRGGVVLGGFAPVGEVSGGDHEGGVEPLDQPRESDPEGGIVPGAAGPCVEVRDVEDAQRHRRRRLQ